MKKFLRIIIAIMILPLWIAFTGVFIVVATPLALYDWLSDKNVSYWLDELQDIWLSLYRWVRL